MLNTEILKYWFCVKLLLYHKFLNNGLILQVVNKIFYPKCSYLTWFWNITASSNWEALHALKKTLKNFMAPFHGWDSTASRLEPFQGGSLLFTTKFPEIPGLALIWIFFLFLKNCNPVVWQKQVNYQNIA